MTAVTTLLRKILNTISCKIFITTLIHVSINYFTVQDYFSHLVILYSKLRYMSHHKQSVLCSPDELWCCIFQLSSPKLLYPTQYMISVSSYEY